MNFENENENYTPALIINQHDWAKKLDHKGDEIATKYEHLEKQLRESFEGEINQFWDEYKTECVAHDVIPDNIDFDLWVNNGVLFYRVQGDTTAENTNDEN
jgi:hypothetical protein